MIRILSVENMRRSDAQTIADGTPGRELMFRAGKGIFDRVSWTAPVAVICGSGNNAGDGYVIARLLHDAGITCDIIRLSEKLSADGEYYLGLCRDSGIPEKLWDSSQGYGPVKLHRHCGLHLRHRVPGYRSGTRP